MDETANQTIPPKQDISSKALISLVVLTIIISLVSTFTVLYSMSSSAGQPPGESNTGVSQGKLTLEVLPGKSADRSTGMVTLEVLPSESSTP